MKPIIIFLTFFLLGYIIIPIVLYCIDKVKAKKKTKKFNEALQHISQEKRPVIELVDYTRLINQIQNSLEKES